MTKEEAVKEIEKAFEPAFANYIITALTEGATVSDIQHRWGRAYEAGVKDGLEQEHKWIPVKIRPLTDAETADMLENSNYFFNYAFDCRIPEDGEEVLITTSAGEVTTTVFCNEGLDGSYFECYEDNGDVIAWMPKPKSYKTESEDKE